METELPRLISGDKILRGNILNVAIVSTEGRPLEFLEEANNSTYKIVKKLDGLEGKFDDAIGRKKAEVLKIATTVKLRPALIIQNNKDNSNSKYPFVTILPIATIPDKRKDTPTMKRLVSKNDLDSMHYLGRNSYITIYN